MASKGLIHGTVVTGHLGMADKINDTTRNLISNLEFNRWIIVSLTQAAFPGIAMCSVYVEWDKSWGSIPPYPIFYYVCDSVNKTNPGANNLNFWDTPYQPWTTNHILQSTIHQPQIPSR